MNLTQEIEKKVRKNTQLVAQMGLKPMKASFKNKFTPPAWYNSQWC